MRICRNALIAVLFIQSVFAQQSTFDFLRTDVGARAAALGGSFVSAEDDPNVLFYNPAALTTMSAAQLSVGYFKYLLDINSGSAAYAQYLNDIGYVGFGVIYMDYGSFAETDQSANVLGSFGASDLAFIAGWGTVLDEHTSVGVSLEFVHSSIAEYSSSGIGIGAGIFYAIPSQHITIGASLLHVGKQLTTFDGVAEPMPTDLTIGISKKPEHLPITLSLDFHRLNDDADSFIQRLNDYTFSAEMPLGKYLHLRGGYSNQQRQDLRLDTQSGMAGISLGGGLIIREYVIDYAYNSYGSFGGLHHISFGMKL